MQNKNTGFMPPSYKFVSTVMGGETNSGIIHVEADTTMSLREMVERQLRGQRIPDNKTRNGYYDDEIDDLQLNGTNFNELDLSEKHEVIEAHREQLKKKTEAYNQAQYPKKTAPPAGAGGENHGSQSSMTSKAEQGNPTSEQSKTKGEDERGNK